MFDSKKRGWQTPLWRSCERKRKAKLAGWLLTLSLITAVMVSNASWVAWVGGVAVNALTWMLIAKASRRSRVGRMARLLEEHVMSDVVGTGVPDGLADRLGKDFRDQEGDRVAGPAGKGTYMGMPSATAVALDIEGKGVVRVPMLEYLEGYRNTSLRQRKRKLLAEMVKAEPLNETWARMRQRERLRLGGGEEEVDASLPPQGGRRYVWELPESIPVMPITMTCWMLALGAAVWPVRLANLDPNLTGCVAIAFGATVHIATIYVHGWVKTHDVLVLRTPRFCVWDLPETVDRMTSLGLLVTAGFTPFIGGLLLSVWLDWPPEALLFTLLPVVFSMATVVYVLHWIETHERFVLPLPGFGPRAPEEIAPRLPYAETGDSLTIPGRKDSALFYVGVADEETLVVKDKAGRYEALALYYYAGSFNLDLREREKRGRRIEAERAIEGEPRNWR